MRIVGLDHVQLAMPAGEEEEARRFYSGLLGLSEIPKPPHLARRGGVWFGAGGLQVHLGIDPDFRPAKKAHPALLVEDLGELVGTLRRAEVEVEKDQPLEGYDRAYASDPFGNRIELMERHRSEEALSRPSQHLGLTAIVVRDYDEAIRFYTETLGFELVEDTFQPAENKRWVVVKPPGSRESALLLARPSSPEQETYVGNQTGGRVTFFLYTEDFWRDYEAYREKGVVFVRDPKTEEYGTVAVFRDLYGNLWDLIEPATPESHELSPRVAKTTSEETGP